ncbi:MAG: hypothetical protein ACP5U2_17160 [Bryobacteraceae bacterium]
MVRYKPARSDKKKKDASSLRAAIPCIVLLIAGMALFFLLLYAILRGA